MNRRVFLGTPLAALTPPLVGPEFLAAKSPELPPPDWQRRQGDRWVSVHPMALSPGEVFRVVLDGVVTRTVQVTEPAYREPDGVWAVWGNRAPGAVA